MSTVFHIPDRSRSDTIWSAKITGLKPKEKVTVSATMIDTFSHAWQSQAEFITPDNGEIDLSTQQPIAGTYATADAMGLIWSMICKDTHGLLSRRFDLSPATIEVSVSVARVIKSKKIVTRYLHDPSVTKQEIRSAGIVGTLYASFDNGQKKPAVIILSGSEGGFRHEQAALLASEGYVTLALAYFNVAEVPGFPTQIKNIPLEYFEKAIHFLKPLVHH